MSARSSGAVLIAAAALLLAGCDGSAPSPLPANGPAPRIYHLRLGGDPRSIPWNRTLYLTLGTGESAKPPIPCVFFEDEPGVNVKAIPGDAWLLRSEPETTAAVERMLWISELRGVFGDEGTIEVPLAPRAEVVLTGSESDGGTDDVLTCFDEESGSRLAAVRNSTKELRFAVWDAKSWRAHWMVAPPRPWTWDESRPGRFVVAARAEGRHWIALRAELRPGTPVVLDVAAQPKGGGTVVCDAAGADLLLGGDLPVPCVRLTEDTLRARWAGVPPGKHAVRYPDGTVVAVEVADGAEVTLPRIPPSR